MLPSESPLVSAQAHISESTHLPFLSPHSQLNNHTQPASLKRAVDIQLLLPYTIHPRLGYPSPLSLDPPSAWFPTSTHPPILTPFSMQQNNPIKTQLGTCHPSVGTLRGFPFPCRMCLTPTSYLLWSLFLTPQLKPLSSCCPHYTRHFPLREGPSV